MSIKKIIGYMILGSVFVLLLGGLFLVTDIRTAIIILAITFSLSSLIVLAVYLISVD